jgi:uncharacterized protein
MSLLRGTGRAREFLRFVLAVGWLFVAYFLSDKAAHGFTQGEAFPLLRDIFQIFLLIVGFGYMEMAWDRSRDPLRSIGLVVRPGAVREFGLGAALGWGIATTTILIVVLGGHFYVRLRGSAHAWAMFGLQLLTIAVASLAAELAFRGYPFQKLVQATGPVIATIFAGIFFALLRMETPSANVPAMWISGVAALLLSAAYLRTRALWLCWGIHFAWLASIGLLFGQPLAHIRNSSTVVQSYVDGPPWLTGGEYGPEGSVVALILFWVALYVLFRITRDLAWRYTHPELKPAGIPMDVSHPMHPAPPPAAAQASPAASPSGLVQIAPVNVSNSTSDSPTPVEPMAPVQPSTAEHDVLANSHTNPQQ